MRLIDADRAWSITQSEMDMQDTYLPRHFKKWVLDETPTVDPVKHGHWELPEERGHETTSDVTCSVCGKHLPSVTYSTPIFAKDCKTVTGWEDTFDYIDCQPYCPNCGAKMDEEVNE